MNVDALDKALSQLVEKKIALSHLTYNDEQYDLIEEELHNLEDDLVETYGDHLEDMLADVHDELCPDNDVLLPIAYIANGYEKIDREGTITYRATSGGVIVDVDEYPNQLTRLVLVPAPTRLVLQVGKKNEEVVWKAE